MRRHVFVSHASADHALAAQLCGTLEAESLPCWMAPRDILPGADWAEQIIDGIDAAWAVLLILGPEANRSSQVRREVERAVHKDVAVLALRIADVALSKSLEYFLSSHHWIDAAGGLTEAQRASIVRALRTLRGDAAPDAAAPAAPAGQAAVPVPAPRAWDARRLEPITERLAQALGPVAPVLVARAAVTARSEAELVEMLAQEIDDPRSRSAFVAATRRR